VAERPPDVLGDPTVQPFDRRDEHIVEEATGQRSVIDVDVDVPWSIGMPRTAARRCRTATSSGAFRGTRQDLRERRLPRSRSGEDGNHRVAERSSSTGGYPSCASRSLVCGSGAVTTKRTLPPVVLDSGRE
jgi:hypothetical protein